MYLLISSVLFFFFKQKTAYEMRISDWSSDVCSSDLLDHQFQFSEGKPHGGGDLCIADRVTAAQMRSVDREGQVSRHRRHQRITDRAINFEIGRASRRERVCQYV